MFNITYRTPSWFEPHCDTNKRNRFNALAPGRDLYGILNMNFSSCFSVWYLQATSYHLSQCWSTPISPYDATGPEWVKWKWWLSLYLSFNKDSSWSCYDPGQYTIWAVSSRKLQKIDIELWTPLKYTYNPTLVPYVIGHVYDKEMLFCSQSQLRMSNLQFINSIYSCHITKTIDKVIVKKMEINPRTICQRSAKRITVG